MCVIFIRTTTTVSTRLEVFECKDIVEAMRTRDIGGGEGGLTAVIAWRA